MTAPLPVSRPPRPDAAMPFAAASPAAESQAGNVPTRALIVPDGELIILRIKPSLWMLVSRVWIFALLGAVLALNLAGSFLSFATAVTTRLPIVGWNLHQFVSRLGVVILLICLAVIAWRFLDWWNKTYVLTDRRMVVQTGVLRLTTIDAPLRRIQHVSLHRGVEQRLFSTGTLVFSTAGPFGEFAWLMISHPEHRLRIVRETIERYARGNGAT